MTFPIHQIDRQRAQQVEPLGSKPKFWYSDGDRRILFKAGGPAGTAGCRRHKMMRPVLTNHHEADMPECGASCRFATQPNRLGHPAVSGIGDCCRWGFATTSHEIFVLRQFDMRTTLQFHRTTLRSLKLET